MFKNNNGLYNKAKIFFFFLPFLISKPHTLMKKKMRSDHAQKFFSLRNLVAVFLLLLYQLSWMGSLQIDRLARYMFHLSLVVSFMCSA